jgi:pilus assembly protein CpaF
MFGRRGTSGPTSTPVSGGHSTLPPNPDPTPSAAPTPSPSSSAMSSPTEQAPSPSEPVMPKPEPVQTPTPSAEPAPKARRADYYDIKTDVFSAMIDTIDLAQLTRMDNDSAREEIRDVVTEIIALKNLAMSIADQEMILEDICNDVMGFGPLEPLLARDDIADIMVNGADSTFIEVEGKVQLTSVKFRDNQQLMNICQRIVSQVGRRVDESSPICDARLLDGSRVNVIAPPLAIDGPTLTIRKFKKDKLTCKQLVNFGSITPEGATGAGDHRQGRAATWSSPAAPARVKPRC